MHENHQPEKLKIDGWHFRIQKPTHFSPNSRVMLLLHGYEGNENVMWILTKPLPDDYVLIAPRAPIQTGEDQFVWHEIAPQWPDIQAYRALADQLITRADVWLQKNKYQTRSFDLMGFSQGAVMAYALSILYPEKINRVAALAGFIPHNWKAQVEVKALKNKSFFIAHGTQDNIIPLSKARQAASWLEENGAHVTFCTADIGHKLSPNCYNGLGEFFD